MAGRVGKVEAGKIYTCKTCGKTPTVGDTRYYQNLGTKDTPVWIGCTDLECFKKQGGTYDPDAKPFQKYQASKFPISKAVEIFKVATELTDAYKKLHPNLTHDIEAQFTESMFKTLSGNFKEG